MREPVRGVVLLVAGAGMLGSAVLHGIVNVPHLREDLLEIGVRPTLLGAVTLVLYFSVVAMFAFAGLVLSGALASFRGRLLQPGPLWIVAATYMVFGIGAFAAVGRSVHFLGYAVMGLLVGLGAAQGRRGGPAAQTSHPDPLP